MAKPTQAEVKEMLEYNPETGVFVWKIARGSATPGMIAGRRQRYDGYVDIRINRVYYGAHRLAWFYVYGEWPSNLIDHKDGDPSNNAMSNLREATASQNQRNRKTSITNTSGVKGVAWRPKLKKWAALIRDDGRVKLLGLFKDIEDAKVARKQAEQRVYKEFANAR